jgi:hypothetical protein
MFPFRSAGTGKIISWIRAYAVCVRAEREREREREREIDDAR